MSRTILLRPPSVFSRSTYSAAVTMPLALAYLAACLRERGHTVDLIDALGEDLSHVGTSYSPNVQYRGLSTERILERLDALSRVTPPQALAVTTMFSQDWPHVEDMINAIHARFPELPIILGGEHATAAGDYILRSSPAVTHVALGEGEETIVDYAEFLDGRRKISDVAGIKYISGGDVVTTAPRGRVRAVDKIPWPAWDMFNLEPYFATGEGHGVERGRSMPILATRGCPYSCTFCSNPAMWTTKYIMRSVPGVVDEIEQYITKYRADNIDFFDLTAIIKRDWILAFCREIKRRGLRFTWQLPSGTRSEAMDAEVLREMALAGCMNVTYAPESGSVKTLKAIKKKVALPKMYDSIRQAKKNGIFVKCNLIIGFPRETRWEMLQTIRAALRFAFLGIDDTGIYPYSPYPGTELYEYLRGTGAISKMDRAYFEGLMSFMDLRQSTNYCENVGPREIAFYRLLGMSGFYSLSYLLHPARIVRLIRNYRANRSDTVLEERLFALLRRRSLAKARTATAEEAVTV